MLGRSTRWRCHPSSVVDAGQKTPTPMSVLSDRECHFSMIAHTEQLLEDMGVDIDAMVPDWLSPFVTIDLTGLGVNAAADLYVSEDTDGTHRFQG